MNQQAALVVMRDFITQNMKLRNPHTAARSQLNSIHKDLQDIIHSNYQNTAPNQQVLFEAMSTNRLDKLFSDISFNDSMRETEAEMLSLGMISDQPASDSQVPLPFKAASEPIVSMTRTNEYQHLILHTLDYMYDALQEDMSFETRDRMMAAYTELNDETLYQNPQRFANFKRTCTEMTKITLTIMQSVLHGFQKDKAKLQARLQLARDIDRANAESTAKYGTILQQITAEDVTLFKEITIGSDSKFSTTLTSFICGECGELVYPEEPLVAIDSNVFAMQLAANSIRQHIFFATPQCPSCHKYNMFPAHFMTSLEQLLTERNQSLTRANQTYRDLRLVTAGQGLLDAAAVNLSTLMETEAMEGVRVQMSEDYDSLPTIKSATYQTISAFPEFRVDRQRELVADTLKDMDKLRASIELERKYPVEVSNTNTDQEAGATNAFSQGLDTTDRQLLLELYGDRVHFNAKGEMSLDASQLTVGFAKLFIEQSVTYGYSADDLLKSVCSSDTSYYDRLEEYRDFITLEASLNRLRLMLENLGYTFETGYMSSLEDARLLYEAIMQKDINLYTILPSNYQILLEPWSGINLTPIEKVHTEEEITQIEDSMKAQLAKITMPEQVSKSVLQHITEYARSLRDGSAAGYPKTGQTINTLWLLTYCEIAIQTIRNRLPKMEDIIVDLVKIEADAPETVIDLGTYNYPATSPFFILSTRLRKRLVDTVYYRMLKNTLYLCNIPKHMGVTIRDSRVDPYSLYHAEIRRIKSLLSQIRIPDIMRKIFCANFNYLYDYYISGQIKEKQQFLTLNPNANLSALSTKIAMLQETTGYNKFITELYCDTINILTQPKIFTDITFIQEDALDLHINTTSTNEKALDQIAGIIANMPCTSTAERDNLLGYFAVNQLTDSPDMLSTDEINVGVWNGEDSQEEDVRQQKQSTISIALTMFEDLLPEQTRQSMLADITELEGD